MITRKISAIQVCSAQQNRYLAEHPRVDDSIAIRKVRGKENALGVGGLVKTTCTNRTITVQIGDAYLAEVNELEGCYALKTDLPVEAASTNLIHDRCKDLLEVEQAFRACKTGHLEVRPIYVRKETRTRGHVFIVRL